MSKGKWIALIIVVLVLAGLILAGAGRRGPAPVRQDIAIPVQAEPARLGELVTSVPVTGSIKSYSDVALSCRQTGRVLRVAAQEGQRVQAGQVLIQLDPGEKESQLQQALAALAAARSRLEQKRSALRLQQTQSGTETAQARAGLAIAKERLAVVRQGARSQELAMAESGVKQAKQNLELAQSDRERYRSLLSQGAVSQQTFDSAETRYQVALAQYESAQQQLDLVRTGARPEEVAQAEQAVRQAQEALRLAQEGGTQVALRKQEIEAAQAELTQVQASVAYSRDQLSQLVVSSPITGTVYYRNIEPGETVVGMSNSTLLKVADLSRIYLEAEVSETDIQQIHQGARASIGVDALPGRPVIGRVDRIIPVAGPGSRNFTVKIAVPNPGLRLRPGMFGRAEIEVSRRQNALLIPKDAVIPRGQQQFVTLVDGGRAQIRRVRTGAENDAEVEVLSGLQPGEQVVVVGGQGLRDGDRVKIK